MDRLERRNKAATKKHYWLRLTYACNNKCIFCLDKQNQNGTVKSLNDIRKEMEQGKKEGAIKLILSGGDPTVHPKYLDIVKMGKDFGYKEIQTVTNGRMFYYKDFLKKAVKNGLTEITFSIHGHTKELYEKQSRVKDSFEQALGGLLNALSVPGLIVNIDIVINKINYKYLEDILRFFIKLGVAEFDLLQVMPFGDAWENRKKVLFDIKRALPYLRKAFALQKEFPYIYLWTNRFPPAYLEGFEELIQHPVKLYDEVRGRKEMFDDFLEKDIMMRCYGEQCRYCFIKNFCQDLIYLKKNKKIKSKRFAYCLRNKYEFKEKEYKVKGKIDIYDFVDFYIKNRYFVKSLRCKNCKYNKICDGAPIMLVREKGFGILKPFKSQKSS